MDYIRGKEIGSQAYEALKETGNFKGSKLFMEKYGIDESTYKTIWVGAFSIGWNSREEVKA